MGGLIMCGIVGFTNFNSNMRNEEAQSVLKNMNDTLKRRGPDENGMYISDDICIAHRRLVVIDKDGNNLYETAVESFKKNCC